MSLTNRCPTTWSR